MCAYKLPQSQSTVSVAPVRAKDDSFQAVDATNTAAGDHTSTKLPSDDEAERHGLRSAIASRGKSRNSTENGEKLAYHAHFQFDEENKQREWANSSHSRVSSAETAAVKPQSSAEKHDAMEAAVPQPKPSKKITVDKWGFRGFLEGEQTDHLVTPMQKTKHALYEQVDDQTDDSDDSEIDLAPMHTGRARGATLTLPTIRKGKLVQVTLSLSSRGGLKQSKPRPFKPSGALKAKAKQQAARIARTAAGNSPPTLPDLPPGSRQNHHLQRLNSMVRSSPKPKNDSRQGSPEDRIGSSRMIAHLDLNAPDSPGVMVDSLLSIREGDPATPIQSVQLVTSGSDLQRPERQPLPFQSPVVRAPKEAFTSPKSRHSIKVPQLDLARAVPSREAKWSVKSATSRTSRMTRGSKATQSTSLTGMFTSRFDWVASKDRRKLVARKAKRAAEKFCKEHDARSIAVPPKEWASGIAKLHAIQAGKTQKIKDVWEAQLADQRDDFFFRHYNEQKQKRPAPRLSKMQLKTLHRTMREAKQFDNGDIEEPVFSPAAGSSIYGMFEPKSMNNRLTARGGEHLAVVAAVIDSDLAQMSIQQLATDREATKKFLEETTWLRSRIDNDKVKAKQERFITHGPLATLQNLPSKTKKYIHPEPQRERENDTSTMSQGTRDLDSPAASDAVVKIDSPGTGDDFRDYNEEVSGLTKTNDSEIPNLKVDLAEVAQGANDARSPGTAAEALASRIKNDLSKMTDEEVADSIRGQSHMVTRKLHELNIRLTQHNRNAKAREFRLVQAATEAAVLQVQAEKGSRSSKRSPGPSAGAKSPTQSARLSPSIARRIQWLQSGNTAGLDAKTHSALIKLTYEVSHSKDVLNEFWSRQPEGSRQALYGMSDVDFRKLNKLSTEEARLDVRQALILRKAVENSERHLKIMVQSLERKAEKTENRLKNLRQRETRRKQESKALNQQALQARQKRWITAFATVSFALRTRLAINAAKIQKVFQSAENVAARRIQKFWCKIHKRIRAIKVQSALGLIEKFVRARRYWFRFKMKNTAANRIKAAIADKEKYAGGSAALPAIREFKRNVLKIQRFVRNCISSIRDRHTQLTNVWDRIERKEHRRAMAAVENSQVGAGFKKVPNVVKQAYIRHHIMGARKKHVAVLNKYYLQLRQFNSEVAKMRVFRKGILDFCDHNPTRLKNLPESTRNQLMTGLMPPVTPELHIDMKEETVTRLVRAAMEEVGMPLGANPYENGGKIAVHKQHPIERTQLASNSSTAIRTPRPPATTKPSMQKLQKNKVSTGRPGVRTTH